MKLLVIGGGIAGLGGIVGVRKYDKDVEIVLVEPKDFMEIIWASYRSPFDSKVAQDSTCLLAPFCEQNNVTHLRTTVTELTKDKATLADGTTIEFDACLIAVGTTMPWSAKGNGLPDGYDGSREQRLKLLKEEGDKILSSKSVVVVGGGLIGTELAGDIAGYAKEAGKDVKVTLVHSGSFLCGHEIKEPASRMVHRKLTKIGVEIILNEKATVQDDGSVVLKDSGKTLEADHVFLMIGLSPINSFVAIEGALDEKGFVETDEYFRVKGGDGKVFGFGDCCTTLRNSGSDLLFNQSIVGENIKATLDGKDKLKKAKPGPVIIVATTGHKSGVAQTPLFKTQFIFPGIKNSTMFLFRPKSLLGLK